MKQLSIFAYSIASILFSACNSSEFQIPEKSNCTGLANLITLPPDTGRIDLMDYFNDVGLIDSISAVPGLELKLSPSKQFVEVKVDQKTLKPLATMRVWCEGYSYTLMLRKSLKQLVSVEINSIPEAVKTVQLAGDINNWQPAQTPLKKDGSIWKTELLLNPGKYSYKVVQDGVWFMDKGNRDSTSNGMGGFNSVLTVSAGDLSKAPIISTAKYGDGFVELRIDNTAEEVFVVWDNYRLPDDRMEMKDGILRISIPSFAVRRKQSALRVWAYNASGAGNDLLIPLQDGRVVADASKLPRDDFHTSILYFMMVDRFFDGDTSNNQAVNDPKVDFKANYQGGDLQGILKKLQEGYFRDLGVNTLWFSPIVQNPEGSYQEYPEPRRWFSGYHGYWPVRTTVIDHRMGNDAALKSLVDNAHEGDMNVLMDFVSNHIHNENPLYKQHPEWFSSMYTADGRTNIRIWDEQRLTTWFDTFMPDIDYTKPEAVNAFSDSAMYWIEKFKLDGFRHDATKHVSEVFWRALTRKLKQRVAEKDSRNIYQIGETFGSRELIGSYIGSGMMDAQFDFNLYFDARPVFAGESESFEKVATSLMESGQYYGSHSLMGNITGNHDMPRFLYYAGGANKPGEDEKEAGWSREINVEDPRGYERLKMLHAFIMTIPGIPVIYYGDEIGMTGANDPDNRRMMQFSGLNAKQQEIKATVKKLAQFRRSSMPLLYGSTRILRADKNVLVYERSYFSERVVIAINRSETIVPIEVNGSASNQKVKSIFGSFVSKADKIQLSLKPLSFEIISIQ